MSITKEKLKLQVGVSVTVTLDQIRGKEYPSKFGDGVEYLFSGRHNGGAFMLYLPVDGQLAITNSGVQPGEEIQLTKHRDGTFTARIVSDAVLAIPAPPAQTGPRLLAPASPAKPTPFAQDNQRREPSPLPQTPELLDEAPSGTAALMAKCLQCAIEVLSGAEKYAVSLGWAKERVEFNAEDVRAMANTFYIQKTKVVY